MEPQKPIFPGDHREDYGDGLGNPKSQPSAGNRNLDQRIADDTHHSLNPSDKNYQRNFSNPSEKPKSELREALQQRENGFTDESAGAEKPLAAKEEQGGWQDMTTTQRMQKMGLKGGLASKAKVAAISAIISLIVAVIGFFAFLPLKLVSVFSHLEDKAGVMVDQAVDRRANTLVDRYLAKRAVQAASSANTIVCDSGLACTLFKNWMANRYEEKLGIKIENNRMTFQSRATTWTITTNGLDEEGLKTKITKEFDTSKGARDEIKRVIKEKTHWYNAWKRYSMRKVLMKKFDVRSWRGPAAIEDKFENFSKKKEAFKRAMKLRLTKATVGRVMPKTAAYMSCLIEGTASCDKIRTKEGSTGSDTVDTTRTAPEDATDGQKQIADQIGKEGQELLGGATGVDDKAIEELLAAAEGSSDTATEVTKIFTKEVVKKVVGGTVAGLGIADMLARIVESMDHGGINTILKNRAEVAYAGYATEMATSVDKLKAGDLDPDNLQTLGEITGNITDSPLAQNELGISKENQFASIFGGSTAPLGTAENPVVRNCTDGPTTLAPNEFVCDDKKVVRNAENFKKSPWWPIAAKLAEIERNTVGKVFDIFGEAIGKVITLTGIDKAVGFLFNVTGLGEAFKTIGENLIGYIFGAPPVNGTEENGDAYDGASAGTQVNANAVMENGSDAEGKSMGGGGTLLTVAQTREAYNRYNNDQQNNFKSQTLLARIFDPNLSGSIMNSAIIRTPSSFSGVLQSLSFTNLSSLATTKVGAASSQIATNAFNMDIYGYDLNDAATFDADPTVYTPESCTASAAARAASFVQPGTGDKRADDLGVGYYAKTDPCALEKLTLSSLGATTGGSGLDADYKLSNEAPPAAAPPTTTPPATQGTGTNLDDAVLKDLGVVQSSAFTDATIIPEVQNIVIHWLVSNPTDAASIKAAFEGNGTSVQFYVDKTGKIWQNEPFANTQAGHARASNDHAIGIEIGSLTGNDIAATEADMIANTAEKTSVIKLTAALVKKFGVKNVKVDNAKLPQTLSCTSNSPGAEGTMCSSKAEAAALGVVGHYQVQANKSDPGTTYIKLIQQGVIDALKTAYVLDKLQQNSTISTVATVNKYSLYATPPNGWRTQQTGGTV